MAGALGVCVCAGVLGQLRSSVGSCVLRAVVVSAGLAAGFAGCRASSRFRGAGADAGLAGAGAGAAAAAAGGAGETTASGSWTGFAGAATGAAGISIAARFSVAPFWRVAMKAPPAAAVIHATAIAMNAGRFENMAAYLLKAGVHQSVTQAPYPVPARWDGRKFLERVSLPDRLVLGDCHLWRKLSSPTFAKATVGPP